MTLSEVSIDFIHIRTFVHATEKTESVITALNNILPEEIIDFLTIKKTNLFGYYKNPIILLEVKIKGKQHSKAVFEKISSSLDSLDKTLLSSEFQQHLDRGNLYLRFDKQLAYLNKIKFSLIDSIRFRIHFKKSNLKEIYDCCKKYGLIS